MNEKRKIKYVESRAKELLCYLSMILFLLMMLSLNGCHPMQWINDKMHWKDDNRVEEFVEVFVEEETGLDLDLSPRSPDEN